MKQYKPLGCRTITRKFYRTRQDGTTVEYNTEMEFYTALDEYLKTTECTFEGIDGFYILKESYDE